MLYLQNGKIICEIWQLSLLKKSRIVHLCRKHNENQLVRDLLRNWWAEWSVQVQELVDTYDSAKRKRWIKRNNILSSTINISKNFKNDFKILNVTKQNYWENNSMALERVDGDFATRIRSRMNSFTWSIKKPMKLNFLKNDLIFNCYRSDWR